MPDAGVRDEVRAWLEEWWDPERALREWRDEDADEVVGRRHERGEGDLDRQMGI
mgnify:CR=1 FL=1